MGKLWRRFVCALHEHAIPDGFDLARRWATCDRCGALFDAAEQDRTATEAQTW